MKRIRFTILFLSLFFIADYFVSIAHFSTIIHKYDVGTNSFEDVFVSENQFSTDCCKNNSPFNEDNSLNRVPVSQYSESCAQCPVIGNGISKISLFTQKSCCELNLTQYFDSLLIFGLTKVHSDKILLYAPKKSPPLKTV